jgi:hypothetical protein
MVIGHACSPADDSPQPHENKARPSATLSLVANQTGMALLPRSGSQIFDTLWILLRINSTMSPAASLACSV